jgi:hypothetical protein
MWIEGEAEEQQQGHHHEKFQRSKFFNASFLKQILKKIS